MFPGLPPISRISRAERRKWSFFILAKQTVGMKLEAIFRRGNITLLLPLGDDIFSLLKLVRKKCRATQGFFFPQGKELG